MRNVPEDSRGPGKGFDETEKRDGRVKGLMKQRSMMVGQGFDETGERDGRVKGLMKQRSVMAG